VRGEITAQIEQLVVPVVMAPLAGSDRKDRLRESIRVRGALYERVAAYQRASQALRRQSSYLHGQLVSGAALHRRALAHNLPPALRSNQVALEALDLATSIDIWIRLRREQGLSMDMALDVVQHLVAGLIAHAAVAPDLIGFGRFDKPVARIDTYEGHVAWLSQWLIGMDLSDSALFCQDGGGLLACGWLQHSQRASRASSNAGSPHSRARAADGTSTALLAQRSNDMDQLRLLDLNQAGYAAVCKHGRASIQRQRGVASFTLHAKAGCPKPHHVQRTFI
jgi:hypothetical protein